MSLAIVKTIEIEENEALKAKKCYCCYVMQRNNIKNAIVKTFKEKYDIQKDMLVNVDNREDYGEERLIGIGLLEMRVVIIVFTEIDEETIRVISLRKALRNERKQYEKAYSNRFECY